MILKLKEWCEGIIVAIVISIIIEMLVPEGNNKKYVKVVIGIYIIFVLLNPLLNLLHYDFKIEDILNLETSTNSTHEYMNERIENVYITGIEENIKNDIESLGYIVENIKIKLDEKNENIEEVELQINKKKNEQNNMIEEVEPVIIEKEEKKYEDIEKMLQEKYFVEKIYIW